MCRNSVVDTNDYSQLRSQSNMSFVPFSFVFDKYSEQYYYQFRGDKG